MAAIDGSCNDGDVFIHAAASPGKADMKYAELEQEPY